MKSKINFDAKRDFVIDPSITLTTELDELVRTFKVKVISYADNDEILANLYFTMKTYFSDAVVNDIMESCIEKSKYRNLIIDAILKK